MHEAFSGKKGAQKTLFLTTQKSSHHVVVRREKRRDSLSLSLSECVCVLLSRLAGFLRRQQRALIIVVVLFESEESSFFCRSSEENRSHLLGREREKKRFFDSVNMSSYRRPDNPERTLWSEFDEKEDCGVTFSKFGIETCEEMITREEDCDRSAAEKSRRCRTERRVGAKKSSKEEEKGKDTLPPFETTPKTINTNNISPERIVEKEEEEGKK